ncbi:MAG: hypothetical protein KJ069_16045 [Anaerolineae bacterium]|nr:hypothetical protein [Anaerolineae bacterium]
MSALHITQRAVADAGSQMHNIRQTVNLQSYVEVYFHMDVVEVDAPNDEFVDFDFATPETPVLEPGKQYRVTVRTELNGRPDQKRVRVDDDLDLILTLKRGKEVVYEVAITDPRTQLLEDNARRFRYEFELIVADELPNTEAHLLLGYRPNQSKQKYRQAASQPVELAGTFNPPDEELLDKCKVALDVERPSNTAILYVESVTDDQIRLIGWGHYGPRRMETPVLELPAVRLADFVETQTDPSEVISIMANFSRRSPIEFVRWIKKLHQKFDASLQLVITDNANSEIPWEMVSLPEGPFLGELWSIVRWFYIKDATTYEDLWMQPKQQQHVGGIIAYYDSTGAQAVREKQVLDELVTVYHNTVQQLHHRLKQSLRGMGMVYLGTHGIFSYQDKKHKIAVGSWQNPADRILALALEDLPPCRTQRPVFFVNACHSGRLIRDSLGLFGLPEILLSHVAGGYIGTLGPVNAHYAVEVAEFVLKKVRQEMGYVNPAEALRRLRTYTAQQEREVPDSDPQAKTRHQTELIYTFMYIYFGNPLSELHLTVAQMQEKNDE